MKAIEGYEGRYSITTTGDVISHGGGNGKIKADRTLSAKIDKDGYSEVGLCKDGTRKYLRVHRLVAAAYLPNPNNLPVVNHKDENPSNNEFTNLEWCTVQYNTVYSQVQRSWLYKGTQYTTNSVSNLCKELGIARSTFYRGACSI